MNILVPIALIGWIPLSLILFELLPPRRAVVMSVVLAWLFLPEATYPLPGFSGYSKIIAASLGVTMSVVVFDLSRVLSFRPRWFDLPMIVWCLCPFASSISNGLGMYDGLAGVTTQAISWGLPYIIGRLYFGDAEGLRELAIGVLIGGIIYVPFCLYEIRMSPTLNSMIYGFDQHEWLQHLRNGGYRPKVFMSHALVVAFWMAISALMGCALWFSGTVRRLWGMPSALLCVIQIVVLVICKSHGAIMLFIAGAIALLAGRRGWGRAAIVVLLMVPATYAIVRTTDASSTQWITAILPNPQGDMEGSLLFRLRNEDELRDRALERPVFGWGGWGRSNLHDESGRDLSTTDGLWIIALGKYGWVGLGSLITLFSLPLLCIVVCDNSVELSLSPLLGMAIVVGLAAINSLPNAEVNPVITLAIGGLATKSVAGFKLPYPPSRMDCSDGHHDSAHCASPDLR